MKNQKKSSLKEHLSWKDDKVSESSEESTPSTGNSDEVAFPDVAQLEQIILESIPKGSFLVTCQNLSFAAEKSEKDRQILLQMIARLHNNGRIDCLKEMERFCTEIEEQPLPDFWLWIYDFRSLFSKLACPLESICGLFAAFDKRGQRDMANGTWWEYLRDRFCHEANARLEMLRLAESRDTFCPGLGIAFSVGLSVEPAYWFKTAIELLGNPGGRSKHFFNTILLDLLNADWKILDSASQTAFGKVLATITNGKNPPFDWCFLYLLCHRLRMQGPGGAPCGTILQRLLSFNDSGVLAWAATNLAKDWAGTDVSERQWSLEAFLKIDPATDDLPPHLDVFLKMLVHHHGDADTATNFLTSYLVQWNTNLSIFPRFVESIQHRPEAIGPTATSWFLSGNPILEKAAAELIPFEFENRPIPAVDIGQIRNTQQSLLPVAAKIIGHLFYKPKTMFSFLFPCLEYMDAKAKEELTPVLFDPVCLSYHCEIRKWMESNRCDLGKDTRGFLHAILERAEADTAHLFKGEDYPELRPPMQLQAELVRVKEDENRKNMDEAYKNSLIPFLANEVCLLHGQESIMYYPGGEGPLGRSVGKLQHHSVSIELPCLPEAVGLEFDWRLIALKMGHWNIDTTVELGE